MKKLIALMLGVNESALHRDFLMTMLVDMLTLWFGGFQVLRFVLSGEKYPVPVMGCALLILGVLVRIWRSDIRKRTAP